MGLLSQKVERSELEAGIYVGEDRVVHFTQEQNWSSSANLDSTCFSSTFCGFKKAESGVTISCLNCFMGDGSLRRYEYGVGRCAFIAKRGGTCTTAKTDDPEKVIHRAMYLLYNGFGEYKLFRNNCEDFALYCKTGLLVSPKRKDVGGSGQVVSALIAPAAAIGSLIVGIALSNPVVLGTTAVGYTSVRYNSDIGVRRDVEKVEVEGLATFLDNKCGD